MNSRKLQINTDEVCAELVLMGKDNIGLTDYLYDEFNAHISKSNRYINKHNNHIAQIYFTFKDNYIKFLLVHGKCVVNESNQ